MFELGPIRDTYLNEKMQFTDTEIATLSPLRLPMVKSRSPSPTARPSCRRWSPTAARCMRSAPAQHLPGPLIPVAGADHFTITHELRDADGELTRQLLLLA